VQATFTTMMISAISISKFGRHGWNMPADLVGLINDCWISARVGGTNEALLFLDKFLTNLWMISERFLEQGKYRHQSNENPGNCLTAAVLKNLTLLSGLAPQTTIL
jgi:hypothetical protein